MTNSAGEGLIIGVDIGGTKVAAGLVDYCGEIQRQIREPMVSDGDAAAGLAAVLRAIDTLLEGDRKNAPMIGGIGICAPGPLDPTTGMVINPPNVQCWRNFPLSQEVEKIYRVKVRVDNDANAAALAEGRWGAGRGCHQIFYATVGTGIGTGIVFDNRIYHGRTGAAGEGAITPSIFAVHDAAAASRDASRPLPAVQQSPKGRAPSWRNILPVEPRCWNWPAETSRK